MLRDDEGHLADPVDELDAQLESHDEHTTNGHDSASAVREAAISALEDIGQNM